MQSSLKQCDAFKMLFVMVEFINVRFRIANSYNIKSFERKLRTNKMKITCTFYRANSVKVSCKIFIAHCGVCAEAMNCITFLFGISQWNRNANRMNLLSTTDWWAIIMHLRMYEYLNLANEGKTLIWFVKMF